MPAAAPDPHGTAPHPQAWLAYPPTSQIPQQRQAAHEPPTPPTRPKKPGTWWKVAAGVIVGLILGLTIRGGNSATAAGPTAAAAAPASAAAAPVTVPPPAATVDPVPVPAPVPVAPAPVAPAGPLTSFTDGTYEVGADIVPGKYKTPGPSSSDILDSCYMEVSNGSGSISGIDQNDNLTGPGVVTLKSGKVFKTRGDCTWTKVG